MAAKGKGKTNADALKPSTAVVDPIVAELEAQAEIEAEVVAEATPKTQKELDKESYAIEKKARLVNSKATIYAKLGQKRLMNRYANIDEKVSVTIAPQYKAHFGTVMVVKINNIAVGVPCNGKAYTIPATHAKLVNTRLARVNRQLAIAENMADIIDVQGTPGTASLIKQG